MTAEQRKASCATAPRCALQHPDAAWLEDQVASVADSDGSSASALAVPLHAPAWTTVIFPDTPLQPTGEREVRPRLYCQYHLVAK